MAPNDMKSITENCYINSHQYEKAKSYTAKNASEFEHCKM